MCYGTRFGEVNAMWVILLSALLVGTPAGTPAKPLVSVSGAVSTPEDPVTCRKFKVTGSLAGRVKECRTESEWRKISDAARAAGQRMVQDNMGRPTGN
jgi:hypothetical protein